MNPVFDVLLRIGKARLARALNVMGVLKPPRRDKLDKKSQELLVQALWLLEHLKNQPELSPGDLVSFGACAAVIGHFAPFTELPLAQIECDAGGIDNLSEGQRQLCRRATTLSFTAECMEVDAVAGNAFDIDLFGQLTDRLGRCLQRLGLERVSRDVTPSLQSYLQAKAAP